MKVWQAFKGRMSTLNAWTKRRPVITATMVTTVKAAAADLMIQMVVEKRSTVDTRRSVFFGTFGFAYQGCFQYWMYNKLYEQVLFPGKSTRMIIAKVLATNLISDPVFFFPTFYAMREVLNAPSLTDVNLAMIPTALDKYKHNAVDDIRNSWMIWVPAHTVTYAFCPPHLRMPWIALVSVSYVCLLSFTRGAYEADEVQLTTTS